MSRFARRLQTAQATTGGTFTITHGSQVPAAANAGYVGLLPGVSLTTVSAGWTPQSNTTYQNLYIPWGEIEMPVTGDVAFINCSFLNDSYHTVTNYSNNGFLTLTNCLVNGNGPGDMVGVVGSNILIQRCEFIGCLRDVQVDDNVTVIECLMRDHPIPPNGAHCECALSNSGSNRNFQRCYMTYESLDGVSSAISMYNQPNCFGFLLEDCYVSGGGYAVYGGGSTNTNNVRIRGNIFGREMGRYSGTFWPMETSSVGTPGYEFTGNTWGAFGPDSQAGDPASGSTVVL